MFTTRLTDAQRERFAFFQEEAAEAIHITSKIERHGLLSSHPDYEDIPNRDLLEREVGHVLAALDYLCELGGGDLRKSEIERYRRVKHAHVLRFLHFQDAELQKQMFDAIGL